MFVLGNSVSPTACEPGVSRKVLCYNHDLMMCEITFQSGAAGNVHAHLHQQITYVAKGSFSFTIGDETQLVKQGDSILIPPNSLHGVKALEDSMLVDVFTPMREDFIT